MSDVIQVALPIPGEEFYSYSVPAHLRDGVVTGKRVLVPFRNRKSVGFITGFGEPPEGIRLRDILDIIDEEPLFDEKRLEFLKWAAEYYVTNLGVMLKAAHPGGLGVSLKRLLTITENGEGALRKKTLTPHETLVLNTVKNSGGMSSQKLLSLVGNTSNELLNSLRRRGLIGIEYEMQSDPKVKTEKIIAAREGTGAERAGLERKYAKAEILDYVSKHGRVALTDLKEIFGNPGVHVKWLEERGYVKTELEQVSRDPFSDIKVTKERPPELTIDQEAACRKLENALREGKYAPFLLHGVTGSGKTEVYLRAIQKVMDKGLEAIVLVPEISLTPLLIKRVRGRFGALAAVIHSALSDGERFDAWRQASTGEVKVIIGARSAIFAPFRNLGMIVVDEEHETTYKQDETPCYNARDLALVLGKMTSSVVILGSATPSLESYSNAMKHRFTYLSLPLRVEDRTMPRVSVIDMKDEDGAIFSGELKQALLDNFQNRRQTILFLNRRGFSTLVLCPACGHIQECPNCSVSLTYHASGDSIKCHLCGLSEKLAQDCSECGGKVRGHGVGTQKVEQELKTFLPEARIARMDSDSVSGKNKLLRLYERLEKGGIDVLIGTQMVAKGHDLPGVTLVGVISADVSLGIPDFRSGERTFQLVTQVAGRAGRGDEPGRVLVQTYNPEHPSITFATAQDSRAFLEHEMKLREDLEYPPFSRLVNFRFSGRFDKEVQKVVNSCADRARSMASKLPAGAVSILGPSPCPIAKIRNRFRYQMLIKSESPGVLHGMARKLLAQALGHSGNIRVTVDVDPYNFS